MVCAAGAGAGPGDGTGAAGDAVGAIVCENAADGAVGDRAVMPPHEAINSDEHEMRTRARRCEGAGVRRCEGATAMFGILG
jgi:hypothetical protein